MKINKTADDGNLKQNQKMLEILNRSGRVIGKRNRVTASSQRSFIRTEKRLKKLVKQLVNSCFCFQLARWNELCATSIISLWFHLKLCLVILNLSMCPIIAFKKRSSWCQGNWPIISHFLSPSFFNATVSQILELLQF